MAEQKRGSFHAFEKRVHDLEDEDAKRERSSIPAGFHTLTPYLIVHGADKLIDFLKRAFDAKELARSTRPDGTVAHAELRIGDSVLELSEAHAGWKPTSSAIHLYVSDADAVYERAIRAGAASLRPPSDQFYGDREGDVKDPSGNHWYIATHKQDLSPEELARREESSWKEERGLE